MRSPDNWFDILEEIKKRVAVDEFYSMMEAALEDEDVEDAEELDDNVVTVSFEDPEENTNIAITGTPEAVAKTAKLLGGF